MIQMTELPPIRETPEDYESIQERIQSLFKREVYLPILKEALLPQKILKNASEILEEAIRSGRITFKMGKFSGRFSAQISKELKRLGAVWDPASKSFKIYQSQVPMDLQALISATEFRFQSRLSRIDEKLAQIVPAELSSKLKVADLFDRNLFRVDKKFRESVKKVTVTPKLTPEVARRISTEWQGNMDIWIKDFAEKEIKKLRDQIRTAAFAGDRQESLIDMIQQSYGVTTRKAKFLARQETGLLMAKYKEARYQEAGINEYRWRSVVGTPLHPTRPRHKQLNDESNAGKIFRFDDPPITSEAGEAMRKNNPGEDFNCRCVAIPVVRKN